MAKKRLPLNYRLRKDGRYEVRFTFDGKRYSCIGATVEEVQKKEQEKLRQLNLGLTDDVNITFRTVFENFIQRKQGTVDDSSIGVYKQRFKMLDEYIGDYKVKDFNMAKALELRKQLMNRNKGKKKICTSTINMAIDMVKMLLRQSVNDGIIPFSPIQQLKPLKRKEEKAVNTIHRTLSVTEKEKFFKAAENSYYYDLFVFLLQTGMRVGEAGALRWSDIDYESGCIHISRTLTKDSANKVIIGEDTKTTAGLRDIPLNDNIISTLKQWKEKYKILFGNMAYMDGTQGLVFVSTKHKLIKPFALAIIIGKISKKAGIKSIGVHSLRDTFASMSVQNGMPPETLKKIMGHESYKMTMDLYYHEDPEKTKQAMQKNIIAV